MGSPYEMSGESSGMRSGPYGMSAGMRGMSPGGMMNEGADDVTYKEYYCTVCKVQTSNEMEYQQHLQSSNHQIKELNSENYRCKVCKITCTAMNDFTMHLP